MTATLAQAQTVTAYLGLPGQGDRAIGTTTVASNGRWSPGVAATGHSVPLQIDRNVRAELVARRPRDARVPPAVMPRSDAAQ